VVSERTIRSHLRRKGLDRASLGTQPARVFGRYEAERPNQRWIGDVLTGPLVPHPRVAGSKRAKLFLLVDDHSRLLVHGRWVAEENTRAGQDVLRQAIVRRGLPAIGGSLLDEASSRIHSHSPVRSSPAGNPRMGRGPWALTSGFAPRGYPRRTLRRGQALHTGLGPPFDISRDQSSLPGGIHSSQATSGRNSSMQQCLPIG
jgi:hypothetical protein